MSCQGIVSAIVKLELDREARQVIAPAAASAEPCPPTPMAAAGGLADAFSLRAQASLYVLLMAFLGFIGWKAPPSAA